MHAKGHITFVPDKNSKKEAQSAYTKISEYGGKQKKFTIKVVSSKSQTTLITLPSFMSQLLINLLDEIATGNPLSIISLQNEISTQEGAELLNVSRPYFVKLLENGEIPFHKVGRHRRVYAADVLNFKEKFRRSSDAAISKLVSEAQNLNMGYDADDK